LLLAIIADLLIIQHTGIYSNIDRAPEPDLVWEFIISSGIAGRVAGWSDRNRRVYSAAYVFVLDGLFNPRCYWNYLVCGNFYGHIRCYGHFRQGNVDTGAVAWMAPVGVAGILVGSWVFTF
mgnify:CR=1